MSVKKPAAPAPKPRKTPPRDRPFEPYRTFTGVRGRSLAAEIVGRVEAYEVECDPRKRKRRPADQVIFENTISAVIADVLHRCILTPGKEVSVPLSHKVLGSGGRYGAPTLGKKLPDLLQHLASKRVGLIELTKGVWADGGVLARRTTIRATRRLRTLADRRKVGLEDIATGAGGEIIVLKRAKDPTDHFDRGEWIDYQDDDTTRLYRAKLEWINRQLARADIEFDEAVNPSVDWRERRLRRFFNNGSFKEGGRLFGGFWQGLSKIERARGITFNGEEAVTLDYGQAAVRILYGMAGSQPPEGDAYRLPGFEDHRAGIKKVFGALLFTRKPLERLPQGCRPLLPKGTKVEVVTSAIKAAHPALVPYLEKGIGYGAMFTESEVMMALVLDLLHRRITALPIHDAVVIPASKKDEASVLMAALFEKVTGVPAIVGIDQSDYVITDGVGTDGDLLQ